VGIWKAREFIEEHSGEELSLRRMAKAVNIHPNYLSERFKQITDMKFVEYVASTRFQRARGLLHRDVRISKIAFAAGFQSLSQFNRIFRRLSGKSPTQFRGAKRADRRTGRTSISPQEKAEKMGSNHFLFLRILAVRVEFETNSMDPR
jgi:AraC-like DNA-binding protein